PVDIISVDIVSVNIVLVDIVSVDIVSGDIVSVDMVSVRGFSSMASVDMVSGDIVSDGFYLDILDHMYTNCPITKRRTYDMINGKWKNMRTKAGDNEEKEEEVQEVQRPMGRDRAKKKGAKSMASSTSGNDDLLDRLMVN
ncbi:hypothetical protein Tco_0352786, partial [Tanacetum coccineum]